MIVGLLAIFIVLVMRFSTELTAPLPDKIILPDGTTATAYTHGPDWYAVVTTDDQLLIFDRDTGALRQTLQIE